MHNSLYSIRFPQQVFAGAGSIAKLTALFDEKDRVLVLSSTPLVQLDLLHDVFALLKAHKIAYTLIADVAVEPLARQAQAIVELSRQQQCTGVLAVGGGSVLDCAKLVALLADAAASVFDLMENPLAVTARTKKLVLVPTTAGTGAEATPNAIVTDETRQVKVGVVNPAMIPDAVILDPDFTMTLPPAITASTGMDALSHALECYISKKANPLSDTYAIEALRLLFHYLPAAYAAPSNAQARHALLYAAFLGGLCIASSGTTAVHALSYPLGGRYHVPHGVSNAMLLPYVMEYNRPAIEDKLYTVAVRCMELPASLSHADAAVAVIQRLYALAQDMRIPCDLNAYGVAAADLDALAAEAFGVKRLLDNNPRAMSVEEIKAVYQKLL